MLQTLDIYFHKTFFTKIKVDYFKNKLICLCAFVYISLFKLPRKYLTNYFIGNETNLKFDTEKLFKDNPLVYQKVKDYLFNSQNGVNPEGFLSISSRELVNPNYKYSIGSFRINYIIDNGLIKFDFISNYHYTSNTNRVTKYLHNWLCELKEKGFGHDFLIHGNTWEVSSLKFNDFKLVIKSGIRPSFLQP